ncbi:MAG: DUF5655 domain-containing protein [Alkalispirochaeta sp.]
MILIQNGNRFDEKKFQLEADFEEQIVVSHPAIFGKDSIYIDAKKKIKTGALGNTIPDGFLFNFTDMQNPEFYLVEVELASHDFYNHIFPQITKFFAFFKNSERQKELVEKLFSIIKSDETLKKRFKSYLGREEVYKFLSDLIDSSQRILLVIDGKKPELPEIIATYSDTWGKMVRVLEVRKYASHDETVLTIDPAFEVMELTELETVIDSVTGLASYTEDFHLSDSVAVVREIFQYIKQTVLATDSSVIFNPQKYYISIKSSKNVAFFKIRKKKIRLVIMLPEEIVRAEIRHHSVQALSESVQVFYNGPCAAVDIDSMDNIEEVGALVKTALISTQSSSAHEEN